LSSAAPPCPTIDESLPPPKPAEEYAREADDVLIEALRRMDRERVHSLVREALETPEKP